MSAVATPSHAAEAVAVNLIAVLVAVRDERPRVLTIGGRALPSGPFELMHRSLQSGLRDWVEQQTRQPIGYVEQLYTFADRDRGGESGRMVSISYLGLTRERGAEEASSWRDWYDFFPWEDRRGALTAADKALEDELRGWTAAAGTRASAGPAPSASSWPSACRPTAGTRTSCCSATSCSSRPG